MKDQVSTVREFSAFLCMEGCKVRAVPLEHASDVWGQYAVPSHLRSQSALSWVAVAVASSFRPEFPQGSPLGGCNVVA